MSSARNAPSSIDGELRGQQRRRDLGAAADFRAEQPQPRRRQQAGVDREQVVAGGVHQPLGGPQLPADPAAHRVVALAQSERQQPHPDHRQQRVATPRPTSPRESTPAPARSRRDSVAVSRTAHPSTARPARQRHQRQRAEHYRRHSEHRHPERRAAGRSSGHGWRALPDFTAGEPFQYWPDFTLPTTPEPGATSAFLPTTAPGNSVVRAPTVASLPTVILPTWNTVAVDPVPGQVDLRFDGAAVAERQHPGDGRRRVQVDALADLVAQCPRVVDQPRCAGQVLGAAGLTEPFGEPDPQVHRPPRR